MKVIVISSAPLVSQKDLLSGYGPYIREMEIWARHSGEIGFLCPVLESGEGLLLSPIIFPVSKIYAAKSFDVKSLKGFFRAIRYSIFNFYLIFQAMRWANHIHLRCPGNISLMGCIIQIFFPHKKKTCKYAGNWDPKAAQPLSYRLQKWILNNTFLTRKMQVLVYGKWEGSSHNIKPFFTATYWESQKTPVIHKTFENKIKFLFVGTLSEGKRPSYAIALVEKLRQLGHNVSLDLYGNGNERDKLEQEIAQRNLGHFVTLMGNRDAEEILEAYKQSHFVLLPSISEGWPKVVAEAMFWGCLPIATPVSCVPYMLDGGQRGILLDGDAGHDSGKIISLLDNPEEYRTKVGESVAWSRQFTLDLFEQEIKTLLTT